MEEKDTSKHEERNYGESADTQKWSGDVSLQQLKDLGSQFKSKVRLQQEPCAELSQIITLLQEVVDNQEALFAGKEAVSAYFFKDFVGGFVKTLTQLIKISITKKQFTDQLRQVPRLLAGVLTANICDPELVESMKCFFDHKSRLYEYHCLSEENAILMASTAEKMQPEERQWRQTLDAGAQLDAIKVDPEQKVTCWSQGFVKARVAEDRVRVSFDADCHLSDRELSIFSPQIAERGTKTREEQEWRSSLEAGHSVDCFDSTGTWYACTVLGFEVREYQGAQLEMVHIAFRVGHPEGDKTDASGNRFFGWDESFDEWLPRSSARLQKYKSRSDVSLQAQSTEAQNKGSTKRTAASDAANEPVNDYLDLLVTHLDGQEIFAVQRKQCRSDLLIDFLNSFGRLMGFERILSRIESLQQDPRELHLLAGYVECLAKSAPVLHRKFVDKYCERFAQAIKSSLLQATAQQLRNTRKERFDELLNSLYKGLLSRIVTLNVHTLNAERHAYCLQLGVFFLSQDFLEKRIDGLRLVSEVASHCLSVLGSKQSSAIQLERVYEQQVRTVESLAQQIAMGGRLLTQIFSKERTHSQLVQRSEQVLRLLMATGLLSAEDRDLVWTTSEINDGDLKVELFKALLGAASDMSEADRTFFVSKVAQVELQDLIDRHIELVVEICMAKRRAACRPEVINQGLEFLWRVAIESENSCAQMLVNRASMGFSTSIEGIQLNTKLEYIQRLLACLKANKQGYLAIKMLVRLLKSLFSSPEENSEFKSLAEVVDYLEARHGVLQAIFDNFRDYMRRVKAEVDAGRVDSAQDVQSQVIQDTFMHSDQITERLGFIRYYASSSPSVQLDASHLEALWDLLLVESPIESDSKQMYQWLRQLCDQLAGPKLEQTQTVVSMDELFRFYNSRMALENQDIDEYKLLSIQGYQCIQSFFVLINEKKGKLRRISDDSGIYRGAQASELLEEAAKSHDNQPGGGNQEAPKKFTSYNNVTGAAYTSYSFTKESTTSQNAGTDAPSLSYGPQPRPQGQANDTSKFKVKDEDPDDLEVEVLVSPEKLDGYNAIWRVATESTSKQVIDSAAKLLIQLHHCVAEELEPRIPEHDDLFTRQCFTLIESQLPSIASRTAVEREAVQAALALLPRHASTIQRLRVLPAQERRIVRALFLLRQMIRASEKDGTHGLKPHAALGKGSYLGCLQVSNNITKGEGYRSRIEIGLDSHATIWDLKKRIGEEVVKTSIDGGETWDFHPLPSLDVCSMPVHPASIRLFQMTTSSDLKDAANGTTLSELKFKPNESLGAFRKSTHLFHKAPVVVDSPVSNYPQLTLRGRKVVVEIFDRFSVTVSKEERVMTPDTCVDFTAACTDSVSSLEDPRVKQFLSVYGDSVTGSVTLSQFERFFIDACIAGQDLTLRQNLGRLGYGPNLKRLPQDGDVDNILQTRSFPEQMPRYKVAENQRQFDVLMALLDYNGEVGQRALEVLGMLVTNPVLYRKVLSLGGQLFDWCDIFDDSNVHKMLYSLEIVEAIMARENEGYSCDWIVRFVTLGGLQELQNKLQAAIDSARASQSNDRKKYVDQLLKLIRIFVMASRSKAADVDVGKSGTELAVDRLEISELAGRQFKNPQKPITRHHEAAVIGDFEVTKDFLFGAETLSEQPESVLEQVITKASDAKEQPLPTDKYKVKENDQIEHLRQVLASAPLRELVAARIDSIRLQVQAVQVVMTFLSASDFKAEDRPIIESALSLWSTLLSEPQASDLQPVLEPEFLTQGLLKCRDSKVRECFKGTLSQICKEQESMRTQMTAFVFTTLEQIENQGTDTLEFFGLCEELIAARLSVQLQSAPELEPLTVQQLLQLVIKKLKAHSSSESRHSQQSDSTLQGLLGLIAVTLRGSNRHSNLKSVALAIIQEESLVEELFYRCLFYQQGKSEAYSNLKGPQGGLAISMCVTKETRKAGFQVLQEYVGLLGPREMVEFLNMNIGPLVADVERPKKWRHLPSSKGRVEQHVGIVNLGCICYMISMLQQFFMVPQFRYQLLKAVDLSPEDKVEYQGEVIDDNLLRQLQLLFGFLELSERHAASAKALCYAFKDYDGTPTKTGEQKDSQEFLNIFFERVEQLLKSTSQRDLLKDVFAGNLCSQLICQQCGSVRNKIELFYNLSLQVKGSAGIYESLAKMVKGQTIEDFMCEGCNQKVNVIKRSLLADMPNVLIVHLQRIVFCFDTLQNDKVNSRFEFPNVLDLKDYSVKKLMQGNQTKELSELLQVQEDEYVYRLVGVNVHVGTADHGHYFSLINTKRGAEEPLGEVDEAKWRRVEADPWKVFDDATIRQFTFEKDLRNEAFGGQGESGPAASGDALTDAELTAFLSSGTQSYGKSAYMLIYERKSKRNLKEYVVGGTGIEECRTVDFRQVEKYMPIWISDIVSADNKSFLVDSQIFDEQFFELLRAVFKVIGSELMLTSHTYDYTYYQQYFPKLKEVSLEIAAKVVLDMLCYYERNTQLGAIVGHVCSIITFSDSRYSLKGGASSIVANFLRKAFLDDNGVHFLKIMFTCTDASSRKHAGKLVGNALERLFKLYADCDPAARESVEQVKDVYACLDAAMTQCFIALQDKECHRNWSRLGNYLDMLKEVVTSSVTAAQYVLDRSDAIADLLDFTLGNKSPRALHCAEKRHAMGGSLPPPFQALHDLISFLICMTYTGQMDLETRLPTHVDLRLVSEHESYKTYFLSEEARLMLSETDFLEQVLFDAKHEDLGLFAKALAHLCFGNLEFSRHTAGRVLKALAWSNSDQVARLLPVVEQLVKIKDAFQRHRLEYLFGFGFLMHMRPSPQDIPQYGACLSRAEKEPVVFNLSSGLDASQHDDALLSLLWRYRTRMEGFTLTCLEAIGRLLSDDVIADYFAELPAPTYDHSRYIDWILPYLEKQAVEARQYSGSGTDSKLKVIATASSLFNTKTSSLINNSRYPPFVITNATEQAVVSQNTFDSTVELTVTRVSCTFVESQPTGDGNLAIKVPNTGEESIQSQDEDLCCKDLLYRISARNLTQHNLQLNLTFHPTCDNVDLFYPIGGIQDYLYAGSTAELLTLRRRNPFLATADSHPLEMGKMNLQLKWTQLSNKTLTVQMSNYASNSDKPAIKQEEILKQTGSQKFVQSIKDQRRNGIQIDMPKQKPETQPEPQQNKNTEQQIETITPDEFGMVNCPFCTLLNPISATTCEMCEGQL